jgi:hypothetical protein
VAIGPVACLTQGGSLIRLPAFSGRGAGVVTGRRMAARKDLYETPVSAIEDSPQTSARLSEPQLDEERSRHPEEPPPRGPQAPDAGGDLVSYGRAVASPWPSAWSAHHARTRLSAGSLGRPSFGGGLSCHELDRCGRRGHAFGGDYQSQAWKGCGSHQSATSAAGSVPTESIQGDRPRRPGFSGTLIDRGKRPR